MHVATLRFDRTAALIDGRLRAAGINFISMPGGRASVQGFLSGAFDAADIPFARYVFWKQQGRAITAIPVFTDRLFQHEYVYTRTDTGIASPGDLRGRRVLCAPSYFSTPSFWHRALFNDDYGLALGDVDWYSAGIESDGMRIPESAKVTVAPAMWLGLEPLLDGTVDVLMTARTAMVPASRRHEIRRVMPDAAERQRAWAQRTGCFPILHVLAIRNESLAARPGFDTELCRAFDESKNLAYRTLQDVGAPLHAQFPRRYGRDVGRRSVGLRRRAKSSDAGTLPPLRPRTRAHRTGAAHRGALFGRRHGPRIRRAHDSGHDHGDHGRRLGARTDLSRLKDILRFVIGRWNHPVPRHPERSAAGAKSRDNRDRDDLRCPDLAALRSE